MTAISQDGGCSLLIGSEPRQSFCSVTRSEGHSDRSEPRWAAVSSLGYEGHSDRHEPRRGCSLLILSEGHSDRGERGGASVC